MRLGGSYRLLSAALVRPAVSGSAAVRAAASGTALMLFRDGKLALSTAPFSGDSRHCSCRLPPGLKDLPCLGHLG